VTAIGETMLGIPRRYSHFVFGAIQAGLTSLIAAGITLILDEKRRPVPAKFNLSGRLLGGAAGRARQPIKTFHQP
jgi:hypothetical protein